MDRKRLDVDPETEIRSEADEAADSEVPLDIESEIEIEEEPAAEKVATGTAAIQQFQKLAPSTPGVYRMLDAKGTVLYVGKAKNIARRVASYTRGNGHTNRISRMIAATISMEFVSTATETEALLLEANMIKRFAPRFNVLLRDDKSFPYISDYPRPRRTADPEASRRTQPRRRLFRPLRRRRRREPHAQRA
jgi:excinuclease ABC subunit C